MAKINSEELEIMVSEMMQVVECRDVMDEDEYEDLRSSLHDTLSDYFGNPDYR